VQAFCDGQEVAQMAKLYFVFHIQNVLIKSIYILDISLQSS
jgi:hypothetical protein